jgi:hypothetical protein
VRASLSRRPATLHRFHCINFIWFRTYNATNVGDSGARDLSYYLIIALVGAVLAALALGALVEDARIGRWYKLDPPTNHSESPRPGPRPCPRAYRASAFAAMGGRRVGVVARSALGGGIERKTLLLAEAPNVTIIAASSELELRPMKQRDSPRGSRSPLARLL